MRPPNDARAPSDHVQHARAGDSGAPGFSTAGGFDANGYGDHSPGHYSAMSCFVAEVVHTFAFLAW